MVDGVTSKSAVLRDGKTTGYPALHQTLAESEAARRRMLQEDLLRMRAYLSTKGLRAGAASFDGRAYLRFIAD